jgi:hypothetical protein
MHANGGGIASKGERIDHLSSYNKLDAGDNLRIPLKPLLAIPRVSKRFILYLF